MDPMKNMFTTARLARGALIGSLYVALTMMLAPISYGPIQVRVSEALTLLPWLWPEAIPGLFLGCAAANFFGGFGLIDVVFGSFATLAAAFLTRLMPNRWLAALPPVLVNALVVGYYLSFLAEMPFYLTFTYVALGQAVACGALGVPLLTFLHRRFPHARGKGVNHRAGR